VFVAIERHILLIAPILRTRRCYANSSPFWDSTSVVTDPRSLATCACLGNPRCREVIPTFPQARLRFRVVEKYKDAINQAYTVPKPGLLHS
jgi:hypothetical protein